MAKKLVVKLTANFERNLGDIEAFLTEVDAPQAFDGLLDELLDTVIPNLERFPGLGRPFLNRAVGSVEATNALTALLTAEALPHYQQQEPRPYRRGCEEEDRGRSGLFHFVSGFVWPRWR